MVDILQGIPVPDPWMEGSGAPGAGTTSLMSDLPLDPDAGDPTDDAALDALVQDEPGTDGPEALLDRMRGTGVGVEDPNIVGDAGPTDVAPGRDPGGGGLLAVDETGQTEGEV